MYVYVCICVSNSIMAVQTTDCLFEWVDFYQNEAIATAKTSTIPSYTQQTKQIYSRESLEAFDTGCHIFPSRVKIVNRMHSASPLGGVYIPDGSKRRVQTLSEFVQARYEILIPFLVKQDFLAGEF